MFSILPKTDFNFSVTFILLSANAFNLNQSEILSFGKEINSLQITVKCKDFRVQLRTVIQMLDHKETPAIKTGRGLPMIIRQLFMR